MREVLTLGLSEEFLSTPRGSGPFEDYNIMQYTGLKDKNGKEIYEGDIAKCDNTIWVVRFDDENAQFFIKGGSMTTAVSRLKFGELIGNIYENPDLINKLS